MAISKSKAFNEALRSIGIVEPIDVLKHLPRKYDDFTYSLPKSSYEDKERVVLLGKIVGNMPKCFRFAKRSVYRFLLKLRMAMFLKLKRGTKPIFPVILI